MNSTMVDRQVAFVFFCSEKQTSRVITVAGGKLSIDSRYICVNPQQKLSVQLRELPIT